ncbi:AfsA-related hotdog domain-containing protein [Kitasatospora aureofaciens]|uniref:AfsA-related hotdog domain-containing protein n=1 Tax=Kitasatospora aureofaciens TaxID=1894 RepID=UPI0037CC81BD
MTHRTEVLYLVGDRFGALAANDGVATAGGFVKDLQAGRYSDSGLHLTLINGQGMSSYEWDWVAREITRYGAADRISVPELQPSLAFRDEAHKHREQNVLIAGLRQIDALRYQADLRLDNDNELLLDHTTGQHIQGMIIIEAARQMFLAVTERFYASAWPERQYYYVIKSFDTAFENFLFPLDATVDYEILTASIDNPERLSFGVEIAVNQGGSRASLSKVEFTAFESDLISQKEGKRAARTVEQVRLARTGQDRDDELAGAGAR